VRWDKIQNFAENVVLEMRMKRGGGGFFVVVVKRRMEENYVFP